MNWKCWLNFHDWEVIEGIHYNDLCREVHKKINGKRTIGVDHTESRFYERKVCVRCKKYVDEIIKGRAEIIKEYEAKQIEKDQRALVVAQITEELKYKNRNASRPHARYNIDSGLRKCALCSSTDLRSNNGPGYYICNSCGQRHEPL